MKVFKRPGSPYYYADLREYGLKKPSTGETDYEEAKRVARKFIEQSAKSKRRADGTAPLSRVAVEYLEFSLENRPKKTHERNTGAVEAFLSFMGDDIPIHQVTPRDCENFKSSRLKGGRKKSTVNREMNCVRKMFTKAAGWRYIEESPWSGVEPFTVTKTEPKSYPLNELLAILEAAPEMWRRTYLLYLNTALRRGEGLRIERPHILPTDEVFIPHSKEGKEKYIPLTDEAKESIAWLMAYHSESSRIIPYEESYVTRTFKEIAQTVCPLVRNNTAPMPHGVDGNFHRLRHTAATYLLEVRKIPPNIVQAILGHASLNTTMIYVKARRKQMQEAMKGVRFVPHAPKPE